MPLRPTVLITEPSDHDSTTRACEFLIEYELGCDVIRNWEDGAQSKICIAQQEEVLIASIISESHNEEESQRAIHIIQSVRRYVDAKIPIIILPFFQDHPQYDAENSIFVAEIGTQDLQDLVIKFRDACEAVLRARRGPDRSEMDALRFAYQKHYLSDEASEGMLGTPDENHMVTAEYLRLRLLSPHCVKKEFDDILSRSPKEFSSQDMTPYCNEWTRVQSMTPDERTRFRSRLLGGSRNGFSVSLGPDYSGYAIDPDTLLDEVSTGFGMHNFAATALRYSRKSLSSLRNIEHPDKERFCSGIIHHDIYGFQTPILQFFTGIDSLDIASLRRVVSRIREQAKWIPVDSRGILIDENYPVRETLGCDECQELRAAP